VRIVLFIVSRVVVGMIMAMVAIMIIVAATAHCGTGHPKGRGYYRAGSIGCHADYSSCELKWRLDHCCRGINRYADHGPYAARER